MKKNILVVIIVVVLLAVGGGAFYGGMIYGKSQNARPSFANGNFPGMGGNKTGASGSNFISGDIISKDSNSVTLQLPNNNGSKIVFYTSTTQIGKSTSGTADDLLKGTSVSVTGTTSSDGSVTAQSIQIRSADQNIPGVQNPRQ